MSHRLWGESNKGHCCSGSSTRGRCVYIANKAEWRPRGRQNNDRPQVDGPGQHGVNWDFWEEEQAKVGFSTAGSPGFAVGH